MRLFALLLLSSWLGWVWIQKLEDGTLTGTEPDSWSMRQAWSFGTSAEADRPCWIKEDQTIEP